MTDIQTIMAAITAVTGVTEEQLLSPSRLGRISRARRYAYYLMHHDAGMSYPAIARFLQRTTHNAALFGTRSLEGELEVGLKETARTIARIRAEYNTHKDTP